MELIDQANIFRYHTQLINESEVGSNTALGWNDHKSQEVRFKILSEIGSLDGHSVLDAGCGHGDLYPYLIKIYPQLQYYGIEQIPRFLEVAVERYGHLPDTHFYQGDFTNPGLPSVDYTIICGSLNYRNSDESFVFTTIEKLFHNSRIGIGFNLLSELAEPNDFLQAWLPGEIMNHCRKLTAHLRLVENYYGKDFTVLMYH